MSSEDRAKVLSLTVARSQRAFVDPLDETLAEHRPQRDDFVIEADNAIVGFFQIDSTSDERKVPGFLELHEVQIDAAEQGKGYGQAFVLALRECLLREYPAATGVCLTVNCKNVSAYRLYKLGGFVDTGELHLEGRSGPQHIMRCELRPKSD